MTKKEIILALVMFILVFTMLALLVFVATNKDGNNPFGSNSTINPTTGIGPLAEDIPTEGNNMVLTTNSETNIRIINEYDKNILTSSKNLLIMFASWCPNCQEEIDEIGKIINYYKDNKDVNIIVIAHEFNNSAYPLEGIISLLENDVNYGNFEVWVDFGRVIRKAIDPEASTIPMSYVVNKNGKVLAKHDSTLTLEKAQDMLK